MRLQTLFLLLVSFSAFASPGLTDSQEKKDEQERMKILADLGLPLPGSGVIPPFLTEVKSRGLGN